MSQKLSSTVVVIGALWIKEYGLKVPLLFFLHFIQCHENKLIVFITDDS